MSVNRHREALIKALRSAENSWRNDPAVREDYRERGLDRFDLMVDLAARATGITMLMESNDRLVADNRELRERVEQLEKGLGLVGELADQITDLVADPEVLHPSRQPGESVDDFNMRCERFVAEHGR